MSGGVRTFKLANGGYADVPEENVDKWLQRMEQRGIGVSVPEITAEMTVGEPEVIKSAPREWGADEEMGFMERFSRGMNEIGNSPEVRGFTKGLTWGGSDELGAGMNAASGGDYARSVAENRALDERAANEHPIRYGAARAVGMVPGALYAPAAAAVRGLAGLGARAGWGGMQGMAAGALESDSDSLEETASDAAKGGAWGAGLSLGGDALAAGLRAAAKPVEAAGVAQRRANAGGSAGELDAIRKQDGIDYMEHGLDQRFEQLGLADSWRPQSAADVYRKLGPEPGQQGIISQAGQRMGGALDDAEALGARGDWNNVDDAIRNRTNSLLTSAPEPTAPTWKQADELSRIRTDELPAGDMYEARLATPRDLHRQKMAFEDAGKYPDGTVANLSEANQPLAYRGAATDVRNELGDVMHGAGPEINRNYMQGAEDYGDASALAAMAGKRAAANKAGSSWQNPWALTAGLSGASAGALGGGIPGAIAGGLAGYGANAFARHYGQDVAGVGMQGLAGGMRGGAGLASTGARMGAPAASMAAQGADDNAPGDPLANGRGFLLPAVVADMARSNPQALGPYYQPIAQAMQDANDSAQLNALLERLERDPEWSRNYLPQLRARTAVGGGY